MQRYIAIIILFIATATSSMADTNGKLIQRIDSIIDNITQIYGKKQARIDFYKSMAHKSHKPETLLSAYDKLYDEYFVFQFDSAMVYADKAITLADRIGDKFHHDKCRIEKASLLGVGGLYGEAVALLDEIDSTHLDNELRFDYTIAYYFIYTYWADYCHDYYYSPRYHERANNYLKQAVTMLRPTDSYYNFFWGEYYIYVERNDKRALEHYFKTLSTAPVESRWYAMASYAIANNYSANNNNSKYEEYMLRACISDLLNCTRENLAMQDLAMYLFKKGDDNILLAERYINFAMDDAKNYNNRLRIIEISQKLPVIVSTYREKLSSQNNIMRFALFGVSILFAFVVVLLYFYSRQNRLLARHDTSYPRATTCCHRSTTGLILSTHDCSTQTADANVWLNSISTFAPNTSTV